MARSLPRPLLAAAARGTPARRVAGASGLGTRCSLFHDGHGPARCRPSPNAAASPRRRSLRGGGGVCVPAMRLLRRQGMAEPPGRSTTANHRLRRQATQARPPDAVRKHRRGHGWRPRRPWRAVDVACSPLRALCLAVRALAGHYRYQTSPSPRLPPSPPPPAPPPPPPSSSSWHDPSPWPSPWPAPSAPSASRGPRPTLQPPPTIPTDRRRLHSAALVRDPRRPRGDAVAAARAHGVIGPVA